MTIKDNPIDTTIDTTQEKADELSQFLADRLSLEDYLKSTCLIREMLSCLKDDVCNYIMRLKHEDG